MQRKWINQPSTHQPYHFLHGVNVLVDNDAVIDTASNDPRVDCYFLEGSVISQFIPRSALSAGWTSTKEPFGNPGICYTGHPSDSAIHPAVKRRQIQNLKPEE